MMAAFSERRPRVLYLVSHPIQYQAPLLSWIHSNASFDLAVGFTASSATSRFDDGFGRTVSYDLPLLDGYDWFLATFKTLSRAMRRADIIWVHGWSPRIQALILLFARTGFLSVMTRCEAWDGAYDGDGVGIRRCRAWYHRTLLGGSDAFLAIGEQNRRYLEGLGAPAGRTFMVPYAIDNERFRPRDPGWDALQVRQSLDLEPDRPIILYCGKLSKRKCPEQLIEAWKNARWDCPTPALVFAGDGELAPVIDTFASEESLVRQLGFVNQSQLPALYAAADVFVLAAHNEPWGLAVNEAMASGTAVIVSDQVGCAPDLVTPDTGRIVPASDVDALGAALTEVMSISDRLGRAAQTHIATWSFLEDLEGIEAAVEFLWRERSTRRTSRRRNGGN